MKITTKSSCLWSSYYHDHAQDPHDHLQNKVHHRKKRDQEAYRLSGDPLVPSDDVLGVVFWWQDLLPLFGPSFLQIRSCLFLKKVHNLRVNLSFWGALEPDLLVLLIDRGPSISVELYGIVRRGWLQIWRTGLLLNLGRYAGDLWPVEAGMWFWWRQNMLNTGRKEEFSESKEKIWT